MVKASSLIFWSPAFATPSPGADVGLVLGSPAGVALAASPAVVALSPAAARYRAQVAARQVAGH